MTRAPAQLAPSWLPRSRRRHVDRALRKLIHRNACSVCGAPFKPNTGTATGLDASGAVALAGECCIGKLTEIFGLGLDFPLPANTRPTSEQIADIGRRSGVDCTLAVNPSDGPWKDDDRIWFEQNRGRSHRVRMPFPGERDEEVAKTPTGHALIVLVRQVEPGMRIRPAVSLNADLLPLPDDEAVGHALFEAAVGHEAVPLDRQALHTLIDKYRIQESNQ
jgi:hypothetical protein